jgi:hypothetical protein
MRGVRPQPSGLSLHPRDTHFQPENVRERKNERNVADTGEEGDERSCQQNEDFELETVVVWLPDMDSNHDSRLQRPLSYH